MACKADGLMNKSRKREVGRRKRGEIPGGGAQEFHSTLKRHWAGSCGQWAKEQKRPEKKPVKPLRYRRGGGKWGIQQKRKPK